MPHLLIAAVHLYLLGPLATGDRAPGFRDSAFMYYPLYQWIAEEMAAGSLPLFNPYDNFGSPVVEDATTAVFYPAKVVFLITALPYASRFGVYLLLHTLLSAYGAYWCARTMRANRWGATLAAVCYSLSGSVLFQICNVIFLVGAAWLPWALGSWWRLYQTRNWKWSLATGTCLALMVLGGDPQMAYHAALLGGMLAGIRLLRLRRKMTWKRVGKRAVESALLYSAVGVVAVSLSAVQVIPTASYSRLSERNRPVSKPPRSVYEITDYLAENEQHTLEGAFHGLLARPDEQTHHRDIYDFSLPAWAMTQLIWPNNTGRWMPEFRRWTIPFPGVPKIWTPSIFLGLIPLLLAILGLNFRPRQADSAWLTWMTLIFSLGSMGTLGLVAIAQWFLNRIGVDFLDSCDGSVGGVYWLMVSFLPKYVVFRYPAKLFVVASLGIALLAGRRFELKSLLNSRWLKPVVGGFFVATILAMAYVSLPAFHFADNLGKIGAHEIYGPFDPQGCLNDIRIGLVSTLLVCVFIWCSVSFAKRKGVPGWQFYAGWLAVTLAELLLANSWMVLTVDAKVMEEDPNRCADIRQRIESSNETTGGFARLARNSRDEGLNPEWAQSSSRKRLDQLVSWQRRTLYPKFHLAERLPLVGSFNSIELEPTRIEYLSLEPIYTYPWTTSENGNIDFERYRVLGAMIDSERTDRLGELRGLDEFRPSNDTDGFPSGFGTQWVWRQSQVPPFAVSSDTSVVGRIESFQNNRIEIRFERWPGEVLLAQAWQPGWRASWSNGDARWQAKMAAYDEATSLVRPGKGIDFAVADSEWKLILEYWPQHFSLAISISVVAWHVLLAFLLFSCLRRFRSN